MSSPTSTQLPLTGTFTGPTSSAGPSGGPPSQNNGDPTANATLYLYTFLATLVLLLSVSSAIVIRSLILRRRHQRLVEEAIRTGNWLPNRLDSAAGRRRRDIGQKPKLWEAWLHSADDEDGENEENEKGKWGDIMPVYAAYVNSPTSPPQGPVASSAENSADPPSRPPRFIRPFTRRRSPPSPQPTNLPPMAGQALPLHASSPPSTATPAVRVAVLIAMPGSSQKPSGDENGPPVVEIGVVEADVKDHETEAPSHGSS